MRWRNKCIEPLIFCAVAAADLKRGSKNCNFEYTYYIGGLKWPNSLPAILVIGDFLAWLI